MARNWLGLRRRKQKRSAPTDQRERPAEESEQETDLLKRIAAGIALNKLPPR